MSLISKVILQRIHCGCELVSQMFFFWLSATALQAGSGLSTVFVFRLVQFSDYARETGQHQTGQCMGQCTTSKGRNPVTTCRSLRSTLIGLAWLAPYSQDLCPGAPDRYCREVIRVQQQSICKNGFITLSGQFIWKRPQKH